METIIYNGKKYDLETVASYYDLNVTNQINELIYDTPQKWFDRYIELDPSFTDLFDYDINSLD